VREYRLAKEVVKGKLSLGEMRIEDLHGVEATPCYLARMLGALIAALLTTLASAQHCTEINVDRSSGFCTVPDHALTPSEMDASKVCVSNVERPRDVTMAEKNAILAAYGWPADTDKSTGEFDHWLPHWMGGSNGQKNIWFESHSGRYGSQPKTRWNDYCGRRCV
jgi:hypothetical protein